jgi:hypothetical protein
MNKTRPLVTCFVLLFLLMTGVGYIVVSEHRRNREHDEYFDVQRKTQALYKDNENRVRKLANRLIETKGNRPPTGKTTLAGKVLTVNLDPNIGDDFLIDGNGGEDGHRKIKIGIHEKLPQDLRTIFLDQAGSLAAIKWTGVDKKDRPLATLLVFDLKTQTLSAKKVFAGDPQPARPLFEWHYMGGGGGGMVALQDFSPYTEDEHKSSARAVQAVTSYLLALLRR